MALVIVQTLSVIALAIIGLLPRTRSGKIFVAIACIVFLASTLAKEHLAETEIRRLETKAETSIRRLEKKIDELRDRLFQTLSPQVMATPMTTVVPIPPKIGTLQIDEPKDGDKVGRRSKVVGAGAPSNADVWVIVHPIETGAYWVQPKASVHRDGSWDCLAYFGRAHLDSGKEFEVLAIADPVDHLKEGDVLGEWPSAEWVSDTVNVTRE